MVTMLPDISEAIRPLPRVCVLLVPDVVLNPSPALPSHSHNKLIDISSTLSIVVSDSTTNSSAIDAEAWRSLEMRREREKVTRFKGIYAKSVATALCLKQPSLR
jgi:hypothetical protein